MSTREDNDERLKLFEAVLSERASSEDFRRLEALLNEDEQVRNEFALYSQLHVDLRYCFRTGCVEPERRLLPAQRSKSYRAPRPRSKETYFGLRRIGIAAVWLLAVCLAIFFSSNYVGNQESAVSAAAASRPPAPVATLTTHRDAVWEGLQLSDGQALREGDEIHLVSGEARISMGVGAEIATKGPCALRFVSRDRVQLDSGEVVVYVAEWAKGFTIVTSTMEVIDLGTTFTVSVSPDASAETGVLKGQVRVSPRKAVDKAPRTVLVSEGESLHVDSQGRRLTRPLEQLVDGELVDFSKLQPYRPVALYNTGIGFAVGDEDPHWRVIAGPAGEFDKPEFAMVCEPDVRYLSNDPQSSQWVSTPSWRTASANSAYTFQTTFDLTGFDLTTIQLFGRFLADNGIREVRMNGRAVKVESWADNVSGQSFGHPQFRTVNVTDGLMQGVNVVEIDVWNGVFQPKSRHNEPNPMALRVEWYAFGRQGIAAAGDVPQRTAL